LPIRVARFAIDDHSPHSDPYLSPLHCIFLNETLIPLKHLINGTSVAHDAPSHMSAIEYYHVDLGTHEVLNQTGADNVSISRILSSTSGSMGPSVRPG
jgi:Hint domain